MTSKFHGCPLCGRDVPANDLVPGRQVDSDVATLAAANTPGWSPDDGLCRECARRFATALDELRRHGASPGAILPTPLRLGASDSYRGRGITIAFLDSGFYAHPDLVRPRSRILAYVDVNNPRARLRDLEKPDVSSWHGMMTSVVACGNGWSRSAARAASATTTSAAASRG